MANPMTEERNTLWGFKFRRRPVEAPTHSTVEQRRAAFARLTEQYQPILLRAARRTCGGGEDQAQDLVQDTLVKAYIAYIEGRFEAGTNVRAWLLKILMNEYIVGYNRKQKWEAPVTVDTLTAGGEIGPESLRAPASDRPESALMANTLDEPLEKALASLSDDFRVCIVMVDVEEMAYEDVAAALQIPVGTVRSRLFRARQQLHAQLFEYAQQNWNVKPK